MCNQLVLIIAFFITASTTAQTAPPIEWQQSLGGTGDEQAYDVQQTIDGGYVMAGYSNSLTGDVVGNHGNDDFWVVKLLPSGAIQWQKCLGGSGLEEAFSIKQTSDAGFIVAGSTQSNDGDVSGNHGGEDYWVVKLDLNGNIEWQRTLGGTDSDAAWAVDQTTDGGYIVAGESGSNDGDVTSNHGSNDYWVVKLDATGEMEWQKSLGGPGYDAALDVKQTMDGGFIVVGLVGGDSEDISGYHGSGDVWVVKLDLLGEVEWQQAYGGSSIDNGAAIQQTIDGDYIVAGYVGSDDGDLTGNHGAYDYWLMKIDEAGVIQWQSNFGGSNDDYCFSLVQTADSGYCLGGRSRSSNGDVSVNQGQADYWLIKVDGNGLLQWQKSLGGSGIDYGAPVVQTSDGGFLMGGTSNSNDGDVSGNHGQFDAWVVKLGPGPDGINEMDNAFGLSVFPNPTSNFITLRLDRLPPGPLHVQLFDATGRFIETLMEGQQASGIHDLSFSVAGLPVGSYQLRCTVAGRVVDRNFVKR